MNLTQKHSDNNPVYNNSTALSNANGHARAAALNHINQRQQQQQQQQQQHQSSPLANAINVAGVGVGIPPPTPPPAPPAPPIPNSSGAHTFAHKNSLRGTNLARRARSFKDDLLSLMRPSNSTPGRSHSPHSPRNKHGGDGVTKSPTTAEELARSTQTLDTHVRDISNALKHFRDVISKRKLEVLPGNGTVILETIASMYVVIQSHALNENSAVLLSAMQQVYLCLAKLIKLCDEVMLTDELTTIDCVSLSDDNVREVVDLLEDAVRNLVTLAQQKLKEKNESAFRYTETYIGTPERFSLSKVNVVNESSECNSMPPNHLMRPPIEAGQRTSLPDIALTNKERDSILEKSNANPMRASHSTESILRDTSPPPKPPLPNRALNPPPLPPKRRIHAQQTQQQQSRGSQNTSINSDLDCNSEFSYLNYGIDHLSLRSRSPDESSSQCSIDSALNHSRDDDEHKLLRSNNINQRQLFDIDDFERIYGGSFISMKSFRTSTQSVSKRSSDNSFQSSTKSSSSNSDMTFGINETIIAPNGAQFETEPDGGVSAICGSGSGGGGDGSISNSSSINNNDFDMLTNRTMTMAMAMTSTNSPDLLLNHHQHHHQQQHQQQQQQRANIAYGNKIDMHDELHSNLQTSQPPALPPKTLRTATTATTATAAAAALAKRGERQQSLCSNDFDEHDEGISSSMNDFAELRQHSYTRAASYYQQKHQPQRQDSLSLADAAYQQHHYHWQQATKHQSLMEQRLTSTSCAAISGSSNLERNLEVPPPLPMKKKHILAYMEICSASTRSIEQHRHTMCTYNVSRNITHSQTMSVMPLTKELSPERESAPPALPPKNYKTHKLSATTPTIITTPPVSPKATAATTMSPTALTTTDAYYDENGGSFGSSDSIRRNEIMTTVNEENADAALNEENLDDAIESSSSTGCGGDNVDFVQGATTTTHNIIENDAATVAGNKSKSVMLSDFEEMHEEHNCGAGTAPDDNGSTEIVAQSFDNTITNDLPNLLEEIDITPYLVFKKTGDDGPEIKGGYINALIVHASRVQKVGDNAFSEAFITTFRTFITPIEIIERLIHRYTVLFCQLNEQKQKVAKETFSLLVRVVNDLTSNDMNYQLLTVLVNFVYQLVCSGQLYLAKLLRNKFVEKVTLYKELKVPSYPPLTDIYITVINQPTLLDLKSLEIAEQMTLLDAELFQKIEIPEVLLFAKDQCEEKSPNLNKFTEHFNKTSYWARTKILLLNDAKEREKHVIKFIKIMKHLRKMNNYNSYLALLSALDSAPIRRLEWHKTITEGLKEYCTLIDSSSSFRVYRLALAETNPPCIPYIGLVLQDLTFVHVGNQDYLTDGVINFSKRWQQYNIIVNMKRFKKCTYPFRRNERIIRFFDNFDNFLGEEEMWQISESIKPRGRVTNRVVNR